MTAFRRLAWLLVCVSLAGTAPAIAQSTTGTISGVVKDNQGGVIPGATVTIRNVDTNISRDMVTADQGQFRFSNLPVGNYELAVELSGFSKYNRSGLTLALNQDAVLDVTLQPATVTETIQVRADTPLINVTTPEVGVRFDTRRVAELPVINSRDVFSLALSAAGVSQLGAGQSGFATGTNFSVNGARLRSNNFMLDGQDSNDPSITGRQQPINNTDIIQEIRLITNQFAAEFGRSAGAVMNVITKSGTNNFRGSGFVFHNNNKVNARTNLDKAARRTAAPFRLESQYGGTLGGPVVRDNTFFFGSYQRWTLRQLGAGSTLNGAPTTAGRAVLQSAAGHLPQVQALLKHVPVADTPIARSASFAFGGQTFTVPLGSLTGSLGGLLNNHQATVRIDQQLGSKHTLSARYLANKESSSGIGVQVTPPGLASQNEANQHATNIWLTSILGTRTTNEFRVAHQHLGSDTQAVDPVSLEIPSIEIIELGLNGFNAGPTRTAIGFGVNLPQFRFNDTYQFQNTTTFVRGSHALKGGFDIRHVWVKSFFVPTIRGLLRYPTLQRFIDDVPEAFQLNTPLRGGKAINHYEWNDLFFFFQDQWRVHADLTLNLGLRYERAGNTIDPSLVKLNQPIVAANSNDERFRLTPVPQTDTNNWQPRVGFNWNPRTSGDGVLGMLTGGDRLVIRGGYARTHDQAFLNMALNVATAFPFIGAVNAPGLRGAFARLPQIVADPTSVVPNVNLLARTIVAPDFRMPHMNQYSLELQRALATDLVLRVGYIGTRGKDLFQSLEANPTVPVPLPNGNFGNQTTRQDPTRGVIRMRANSAESWYHALQVSLDKRLSGGLSAGAHYTWSKFLDTISEVFNPSGGEIAAAQDPFNIANDKAYSAYDRPHRFTANAVWELPWMRDQQGAVGKILGGWQASTSFTLQSGAPFTPLNGVDVANVLAGSLVGNAIRPNINTDLDVRKMTIPEILAAGGRSLFSPLVPGVHRVGNAGRNILRADGIGNIDFAFIKNTRFANNQNIQVRIEMFNATNTRNFGIPLSAAINSANFLNEKGTDGGARRIWGAIRYVF